MAGKINFKIVEKVEVGILEWVRVRRYKLPLFIFIIGSLMLLSHTPYINLFFSSYLVILTSVVLTPFILDISAKPFFITFVYLFIFTLVAWFVDNDGAEMIAEYIFIILLSGILRALFSSKKVSEISGNNN